MGKLGVKRIDPRATKISKYVGVVWHEKQDKWQVKINVKESGNKIKTKHFGFYDNMTEAAKVYNKNAKLYCRPVLKIPLADHVKYTLSSVFATVLK